MINDCVLNDWYSIIGYHRRCNERISWIRHGICSLHSLSRCQVGILRGNLSFIFMSMRDNPLFYISHLISFVLYQIYPLIEMYSQYMYRGQCKEERWRLFSQNNSKRWGQNKHITCGTFLMKSRCHTIVCSNTSSVLPSITIWNLCKTVTIMSKKRENNVIMIVIWLMVKKKMWISPGALCCQSYRFM